MEGKYRGKEGGKRKFWCKLMLPNYREPIKAIELGSGDKATTKGKCNFFTWIKLVKLVFPLIYCSSYMCFDFLSYIDLDPSWLSKYLCICMVWGRGFSLPGSCWSLERKTSLLEQGSTRSGEDNRWIKCGHHISQVFFISSHACVCVV